MYQDGVTIAIPNWNHEFYLPRSIASALEAVRALRAAGVPGEVLVVDDASRDGSVTLLRALEALHAGDGLRVRRLPKNSGLPAARNAGLLSARYRYIVFLDADNEILGANLPLFHRAIRETAAAAVYGNLLMQKSGHQRARRMLNNESFQPKMFDTNYTDGFALFDRIQLLDVGGYTDALPAWEDWEMWLHLATNGREIVFVPMAFGRYYELPDSMLRTAAVHDEANLARSRRMFNQAGFRNASRARTSLMRYLPGVGYL